MLACGYLAGATSQAQKSGRPERASFRVKNAFTVKVPQGAHNVRVWFAVPQEDAYSVITNFNVVADYPVRYDWDSWGNKVGYLEVRDVKTPQLLRRTRSLAREVKESISRR